MNLNSADFWSTTRIPLKVDHITLAREILIHLAEVGDEITLGRLVEDMFEYPPEHVRTSVRMLSNAGFVIRDQQGTSKAKRVRLTLCGHTMMSGVSVPPMGLWSKDLLDNWVRAILSG